MFPILWTHYIQQPVIESLLDTSLKNLQDFIQNKKGAWWDVVSSYYLKELTSKNFVLIETWGHRRPQRKAGSNLAVNSFELKWSSLNNSMMSTTMSIQGASWLTCIQIKLCRGTWPLAQGHQGTSSQRNSSSEKEGETSLVYLDQNETVNHTRKIGGGSGIMTRDIRHNTHCY